MQSSEELWEQNYEDIIGSIPDLIFDEAFDVSPSSASPKASCKGPKGGVRKPLRRRSRSSKKAPTTLLTADANNFRALVQQFTGCHSTTPLLRAYKGPINLNFKQCSYYPQQQQKQAVGNFKVHEEFDQTNFLAEKNVAAARDDVHEDDVGELFVSRMDPNHRAYHALTYDMYDNFWGQEMSGSGDYSTVLSGALNHEFWGY